MAAAWNNQKLFKSSKKEPKNPCRYCLKRSAECHAYCKEYNEWRKTHMDSMRELYREEAREKKLKEEEFKRNVSKRTYQKYKH